MGDSKFTKIYPGDTAGTEVFLFFVVFMSVSIIFGILFGFLLPPLYIMIHKNTIGRNYIYGIKVRELSDKPKSIAKGIFPTLMALNLAIMLSSSLAPYLILDSVFINRPNQVAFLAFATTLGFTFGPSVGLFSAVWFLNDAGVGYTNKKKVKDTGEFIEFRSVGGWYLQFLKGYAGIGVIFTFYSLITGFIDAVILSMNDPSGIIINLLIVFPLPIYGTLGIIPTLIVIDLIKEKRINYIRKMAKKLGITEEMDYTLD